MPSVMMRKLLMAWRPLCEVRRGQPIIAGWRVESLNSQTSSVLLPNTGFEVLSAWSANCAVRARSSKAEPRILLQQAEIKPQGLWKATQTATPIIVDTMFDI